MPQTKKHTTVKSVARKVGSGKLPYSKPVIVINTTVPTNETLFPGKLKKVNKMLRNVKWMKQNHPDLNSVISKIAQTTART